MKYEETEDWEIEDECKVEKYKFWKIDWILLEQFT